MQNVVASRFICLSLLFINLFGITEIYATHIVGGELNYRCLGNEQYEITMTIYRDCFNGDPNAFFDNPASIGVFGSNNELITSIGDNGQLLINFNGDDTLNPQLLDPCFVVPPNVCVHTTTYLDTISLPFRSGGYTLVYQRCCRNRTILNIVNPLASGATYLAEISEQALMSCNSNPVFKEWPPAYICVDQEIDFDHSAIDFDGDSLVYRLCTPLLGADQIDPRPQPPNNPPYDSVIWVSPPYSTQNMLGGDPLRIDPVTGRLSGVPNTIGQFVVGICVDEYRNGELISSTRRDFQYNVGQCGETTSAFFSPSFICENNELNLINESIDADSFTWIVNGPGYNDSTFNAEDLQLQGLSPGNYNISLVAINDVGCSDTLSKEVAVNTLFNTAEFTATFDDCADSVLININDQSIINDTGSIEKQWELYQNGQLIDTVLPFYALSSDSLLIVLTIEGSNNCISIDSVWLQPPFRDIALADSFRICSGDFVELNPNRIGADLVFQWEPQSLFGSSSNLINPIIRVDSSQFVSYTAQGDSLCPSSGRIWIEVLNIDTSSYNFYFPEIACIQDSAQIYFFGDTALFKEWIISEPNATDTILTNVDTFYINFSDTGFYSVSLIVEDSLGCIDTLTKSIRIDLPLAIAQFEASAPGCGDSVLVILEDKTINRDTASYVTEWFFYDPADSLISTTRPFYINEEGTYTIILKVTDRNGCIDSSLQTVSSSLIALDCCPELQVDTINPCVSEPLQLCGQANLDSCTVEYLFAEYSFAFDGTVGVVEQVALDTMGRFCLEVDKGILDTTACVSASVEVFFITDTSASDTLSILTDFVLSSGSCLNQECCPEDTIPIHISKNLCLTGSNYEGAHFEVEGSILLNQIPEGLNYCGFKPEFENGVSIAYDLFTQFGAVLEFSGQLFVPQPELLDFDPSIGKYIVRGTMIFCSDDGEKCELGVELLLSRSQVDMCIGMNGLMCMHFIPNTYHYRPPMPPWPRNGKIFLPISVNVPFGTQQNGETECRVTSYEFEICGVYKKARYSNNQECKLLSTGSLNQKGDEVAGTFFDYLIIPVELWNRLSAIQITFRNNCGDTCTMRPIPVVPVVHGREAISDQNSQDEVQIYPNPFREEFMISYTDKWNQASFFIYTLQGQLVTEGVLKDDGTVRAIIANNWPSGSYLFYLKKGDEQEMKAIIIKQ